MPDASATIDDELLMLRRENERQRHLIDEQLITINKQHAKIEQHVEDAESRRRRRGGARAHIRVGRYWPFTGWQVPVHDIGD